MILFVDDNAGLLFIKSIEVEIQDPITGRDDRFIQELEESGGSNDKLKDRAAMRRKKQQKEVLILTEVFLKICH